MRNQRRAKKPIPRPPSDDEDEDEDDDERLAEEEEEEENSSGMRKRREVDYSEQNAFPNLEEYYAEGDASAKKKKVRRNFISSCKRSTPGESVMENAESDGLPPLTEIYRSLQFCCYHCVCPPEHQNKFADSAVIQAGEGMFFHRRCCHNVTGIKGDLKSFAGPFDVASETYGDIMAGDMEYKDVENKDYPCQFDYDEVRKRYNSMKREESKLHNDDGRPDLASVLHTSQRYLENAMMFRSISRKRSSNRHPAVVLDLFAGIGTGIIVLKRLGIDMKSIIHCDNDKVASHVFRNNHDPNYNNDINDGGKKIKYDYYASFEEIEDKIDAFMHLHGPIDIVLGGPPCVDYTVVNAARQGSSGRDGSYMIRVGNLIQTISEHPAQQGNPLFFLIENVRIKNDGQEAYSDGDLTRIREAFGTDWDPFELDAKYFSPCIRDRSFFSNIPFDDFDFNSDLSMVNPSSCLKDGYQSAGNIIEDEEFPAKCCTFMASKGRLNDDRMYVFKEVKNSRPLKNYYIGRLMHADEREVLMGLPRGYVTKSVESLYKILLNDGLAHNFTRDQHWKKSLDEKFHDFCGAYHGESNGYQVYLDRDNYKLAAEEARVLSGSNEVDISDLALNIKMICRVTKEDEEGKRPSKVFFTASEYSKRLVGNAYSVPVVEHLLKPLKNIFATKTYQGYDYVYPWLDELSLHQSAIEKDNGATVISRSTTDSETVFSDERTDNSSRHIAENHGRGEFVSAIRGGGERSVQSSSVASQQHEVISMASSEDNSRESDGSSDESDCGNLNFDVDKSEAEMGNNISDIEASLYEEHDI